MRHLMTFLATRLYGLLLVVQVFLDVVESVNILVNSNGQIIRSDVVGALKMRTYLRSVLTDFILSCIMLR